MEPFFHVKKTGLSSHLTTTDIWLRSKIDGWLEMKWAGLCDAFLEEHRWLATSYLPKSDEYLRNGIISTGAPLSLALASLMLGKDSPNSTMDEVQSGQGLFSTASTIFRLSDDLGSSMQVSSLSIFSSITTICFLFHLVTRKCGQKSPQNWDRRDFGGKLQLLKSFHELF